MSVQLTENAAKRIQQQLRDRGKGLGLRLGVREAGCSGYAYTVDFADVPGADDEVFEGHGAKVFIDRGQLPKLDGLIVDYRREGLSEAFRFDNPNAQALCGCGESFYLEKAGS